MRFLICILFVVLSMACKASNASKASVDSIYLRLSAEEKVNQIIWLPISHGDQLNDLKKNELETYGAVYLNRPFNAFEEYIFNRDFIPSLAIQLDERFNPAPEDLTNLPSLRTLSSIREDQLLDEYFGYLREISQSFGIDYVILPDVSSLPLSYQLLIAKIEAYDNQFFINKNRLGLESIKKRKDFVELFEYADYWVVALQETQQADKLVKRHAEKLEMASIELAIKNSIDNKYFDSELRIKRRLPTRLAVKLSRASIVPIQRESGILPISNDTICLITNDPMGNMALMLDKYTYLITTADEISRSKAPVIIDNVDYELSTAIDTERVIIFLGDYEKGIAFGSQLDAALFTSLQDNRYNSLLPQLLFGSADATGVLPDNDPVFQNYSNEPIIGLDKLGYAAADISGISDVTRDEIKKIIVEAIESGSTPGCQLAVAIDGSIVLEEGYGFLTYDSLIKTDQNTLYDLASVTKVTATLLAVMKLYEDERLALDSAISKYLPEYVASNKSSITIRQLLSHNAGLASYVPFWKRALGGPDRLETFYYETKEDELNDRRSYGMKPNTELSDSLKNWILKSPLITTDSIPEYRYSDIGFMILHQIVEAVIDQPMEDYLSANFYKKLGLKKLQFNPLENNIDRFQIAPTEYDYYFRNEQVWGQVHDRNAAVFGGVAGHAGLFSNAHDLLILLQMIAQNGSYNGVSYLKRETIDYFNEQYFPGNRRGLGWDKKGENVSNAALNASHRSFGHTGFTGTMVWVDPDFELVFIFLSNRVYPDANNYKLITKDIRSRVQDVVYEAILSNWIN